MEHCVLALAIDAIQAGVLFSQRSEFGILHSCSHRSAAESECVAALLKSSVVEFARYGQYIPKTTLGYS